MANTSKTAVFTQTLFFDFSSAFTTIQPLSLRDKVLQMRADPSLVMWIIGYLPERPRFVRLGDRTYEAVVCSTGAPQGTLLSPVLFTLNTMDSKSFHMQKFSAVVGCIKDWQEGEIRGLIEDFVG